jgi:hypothetical protein
MARNENHQTNGKHEGAPSPPTPTDEGSSHSEAQPPDISNAQSNGLPLWTQILGLLVIVFGAGIAAVTAGYSPVRALAAVVCLVAIAYTASIAFGVVRAPERSIRRSVILRSVSAAALILLILVFLDWPLGKSKTGASVAGKSSPSSCDLENLPKLPIISSVEATSPLMYKVVSTDTTANDGSAISHQIYGHGWIQQVFLATQNRLAEVSAIIDAQVKSNHPLSIIFQIRTLNDQVIGSIDATYDGSTNNRDFGNFFRQPVSVEKGQLYVLRVINNNDTDRIIAIYAHRLDGAQTVPYKIAGCEYDSFDAPGRLFPMQDSEGPQVLSGFIQVPLPPA